MQARVPVIDDIQDFWFDKLNVAAIGVAKIGISVKCAVKSLLAEDALERAQLREMAKAALVEGSVTTAMWAVPVALFAKFGVSETAALAGLGCGMFFSGIKLMQIGREMLALAREAENAAPPQDDSTHLILRRVGHDQAVVVVPQPTVATSVMEDLRDEDTVCDEPTNSPSLRNRK